MKAAVADEPNATTALRQTGWLAVVDTADRSAMSLQIGVLSPGDMPQVARGPQAELLFDGFLFDVPELSKELGLSPDAPEAQIALRAWARWGDECFGHLRGHFAILVLDLTGPRLLAARDQLGMHPLFYAEAGSSLVLASQVDALFRHPGVPRTPNRAVLAERLCHRYIAPEETAFEAIRRIPGGSVFAARPGARRVTRYWDPAPPDRPLAWASEDELEHFDEIFERAVRRCTRMGQPGVFLSGGLDSIAVAAFAADLSAQAGVARPLALSLAFPHPECAEEDMQRDIANGLGMDQEMIPLDVAAGRPGLLRAALAESASWSFPLCTPWTPAYRHLGLRGHARGCRTILTGRGGDERLALSLSCAADMIRDLDVSGLWDHLRGQMKSYRLSRLKIIRTTLWTFGARPLFSGMVDYVAHDWWRRRRLERFRAATPPWLSPDPSLKRELDARVETLLSPAWPPDGFHAHDIRSALTHPLTAAEFEESHELARRVGVRIVHPFWDVDLVNLLFRVPPTLACRDGAASKSLIRQPMEKRFPGFGLRQQKKVMATNYFISLLQAQSGAAWTALGGTPALGALGVVDPAAVQGLMNTWTHGAVPVTAGNVWSIMNVESWLRGHVTA